MAKKKRAAKKAKPKSRISRKANAADAFMKVENITKPRKPLAWGRKAEEAERDVTIDRRPRYAGRIDGEWINVSSPACKHPVYISDVHGKPKGSRQCCFCAALFVVFPLEQAKA